MRALLDVNVLLALLDQDHVDHERARAWIEAEIDHGWASCAITENGFVRVISQPRYPNPITPRAAIDLLAGATASPHHRHWLCATSLLDPAAVTADRLHGHRQVTDAYLLALATAHGGRFATFDRGVSSAAVPAAEEANLVVI